MTEGYQCDNCKKFIPTRNLTINAKEKSDLYTLKFNFRDDQGAWQHEFCSKKCLKEWLK